MGTLCKGHWVARESLFISWAGREFMLLKIKILCICTYLPVCWPVNKIYIHFLGCNTPRSACVHSVWRLLTVAGNQLRAPLKYALSVPAFRAGESSLAWNYGAHISKPARKPFCWRLHPLQCFPEIRFQNKVAEDSGAAGGREPSLLFICPVINFFPQRNLKEKIILINLSCTCFRGLF